MKKRQTFFLIILTIVLAWLFMIFPGRFLEAKLSTWPALNKLKILGPQAPIVITRQETVRVSDSADVSQAAQQIKSKLSLVVLVSNGSQTIVGAAQNLTSDGAFVTSALTFNQKTSGDYYVVLNDGTASKINNKVVDAATGLEFFKASLNGVPVVSFDSSENLVSGDKIIFAESSLTNFSVKTQVGNVISVQDDTAGQVFSANNLVRSFTAFSDGLLVPGESLVDINGNIVGMWSGTQIISSDVINQSQQLYLSNQTNFVRPAFGFSYTMLFKAQSSLLNLSQGAQVKSVDNQSAASIAGLETGDIITSINNQPTASQPNLETILQNYKAGDSITLVVMRKNQQINLYIKVQQLK